MTNWLPDLADSAGPRYAAIADALAEDVAQGRLAPGARLPTHRELAWRLGVTVGTVSRAYAEAERRGLTYGEVGRGTFVRAPTIDAPAYGSGSADGFVDLSHNFPPLLGAVPALSKALAEVAQSPHLGDLMGYRFEAGQRAHRAALAQWCRLQGVPTEPDELLLTHGAQHAMMLVMMALAGRGQTVLTEELSFYGIKTVAAQLDLRLEGVAMDGEGIRPEALDAACRSSGAKLLYCLPTLQNPTAAVMSEARRREIVAVAERHDLTIVEDDVYGFLAEQAPPPIAALAPERTVYLSSLSKSVAPGLRLGYVRAEPGRLRAIAGAMQASTLTPPSLLAEVGARLILSGEAERLAFWQRAEARRRQLLAQRLLAGAALATHPESFHLWLSLPAVWRSETFVAEARSRGVGVSPAEAFAVGQQPPPQAVRLCLQAPVRMEDLERALASLTEILADRPERAWALV